MEPIKCRVAISHNLLWSVRAVKLSNTCASFQQKKNHILMSMISGVMKGCETETVSVGALKMNRMRNAVKF
jgi:hypothetical protein